MTIIVNITNTNSGKTGKKVLIKQSDNNGFEVKLDAGENKEVTLYSGKEVTLTEITE
jgi:hypothetical protein